MHVSLKYVYGTLISNWFCLILPMETTCKQTIKGADLRAAIYFCIFVFIYFQHDSPYMCEVKVYEHLPDKDTAHVIRELTESSCTNIKRHRFSMFHFSYWSLKQKNNYIIQVFIRLKVKYDLRIMLTNHSFRFGNSFICPKLCCHKNNYAFSNEDKKCQWFIASQS